MLNRFHERLPALVAVTASLLASFSAHAAVPGRAVLGDKLSQIRGQVLDLEKNLIDNVQGEKNAAQRLRTLRSMLILQKQERILGQKRQIQLENFISELENRRSLLNKRIADHTGRIRSSLIDMHRSNAQRSMELPLSSEALEAPRRKVIAAIVDRRLKEVEALRVDLQDADQLESRIQEERQQLAYLFQDLKEQESLLEFHQKLQEDLMRKKHAERIAQLQNYRKLKSSEAEVEQLISQFNARMELKRSEEAHRTLPKWMEEGEFAHLKGKLKLPVAGSVVSHFGRTFDEKSNLYVFKKGIEISFEKKQEVRAVAGGKVVYSGVLPSYGKVTIIDHGAHYYSLCARLGDLKRKVGDIVIEGDELGWSSEPGQPVYFEIRARNVAVNPLQWFTR